MGTEAPSETGTRAIQSLLEKHACRVPYHAVRTRFLGNIASPAPTVSPVAVVKNLWGGELPIFDKADDVNKLFGSLINGLWNELTRHQKRSEPFRLVRLPMEPTVENLGRFGEVRGEELEGFLDGLFNGQEEMSLPERAHEAVRHLSELRAMMAGIHELAVRQAPVDTAEIETTFKGLREITLIMEKEIHAAVLSCGRARKQMLAGVPTTRSTVH